MRSPGPRSVAARQRVPGRLSPGPAKGSTATPAVGPIMRARVCRFIWVDVGSAVTRTSAGFAGYGRGSGLGTGELPEGSCLVSLGGSLQIPHLFWGLCCPLRSGGGQSQLQGDSCKSSMSSSSRFVPCCPSPFLPGAWSWGRGGRAAPHGVPLPSFALLPPLTTAMWVQ